MEQHNDYIFVTAYLTPGENLVWKGRPEKGNLFLPSDIFISLFGLFFLGFSLYWEYSVLQSGNTFMIFWGLPFIAIGAFLTFGRFLYKAYMRDKTFYAVTNKKLIIRSGRRTMIYHGKDLPPMTIHIHADGNGTIVFTETVVRSRNTQANTFSLENLRDFVLAQQAIDAIER